MKRTQIISECRAKGKTVYEHIVPNIGNLAVIHNGHYVSAIGYLKGVYHYHCKEVSSNLLVDVPSKYRTKPCKVHKEMLAQLTKMIDDCRKETPLYVSSGFRAFNWVDSNRGGVRSDARVLSSITSVAPAGFSQHSTGLAVDFCDKNGKLLDSKSKAYVWLAKNASKYGFKQTFNAKTAGGVNRKFGKLVIEPWHFVYDGTSDSNTLLQGSI